MDYHKVAEDLVKVAFQKVTCITSRDSTDSSLIVGEDYFFDRLSIFIDCNGDAFGIIHDSGMQSIGVYKLNRFKSVSNIYGD